MNTTAARRVRRTPVVFVLFLGLLSAWLILSGAKPALADTSLCSNNSYSNCTGIGYTDHGYGANNGNMYWSEFSGHNCTNYAAYVEQAVNGASTPTPNHLGNASEWDNNATADGTTVDTTPGVGSVAQWEAGYHGADSSGHVAYVEAVSKNSDGSIQSITVSEDNWQYGPFDWRTITPGGGYWPSHFIHFKDLASAGTVNSIAFAVTSDGTYHLFSGMSDGTVDESYWTPGNSVTTDSLGNVGSAIKSIAFAVTSDGTYHVFTGTSSGAIYETYWVPGSVPPTTDTLVSYGSSVNSIAFAVTGSTYHVFSGAANGYIYETYWTSGGSPTTATLYNVGSGSSVNSIAFALTGTTYHVYSGLANGTIHETYWVPGSISPTDSTLVGYGSSVSSIAFALTGGTYHVFSGAANGYDYETYWVPRSSSPNTTTLGNPGNQINSIAFGLTGSTYPVFTGMNNGAIDESYWTPGNSVTTYQLVS